MEIGKRYNEGKLDWRLIKLEDLEPLVRVLMFGKEKYDEANWKKGLPISDIINSLTRHLAKLQMGRDTDEESGLEETGHLMCNIYFIQWLLKHKPWFDDRPESTYANTAKKSNNDSYEKWRFCLDLHCDRNSVSISEDHARMAYEADSTIMQVINSFLS